jgi:T4 superinfection immunity protein
MDAAANGGGAVVGLLILAVGALAYFAPWGIANFRGREGQGMIFLLNLFLGWTVLGWFILLIVAFTGDDANARRAKAEHLELMRKMVSQQQRE